MSSRSTNAVNVEMPSQVLPLIRRQGHTCLEVMANLPLVMPEAMSLKEACCFRKVFPKLL